MFITVGKFTSKGLDCCEHEHETRDEAQECLLEHQAEMRKQNKVSDRRIAEVDSLDEIYEEAMY